jgi:hypothetical protein
MRLKRVLTIITFYLIIGELFVIPVYASIQSPKWNIQTISDTVYSPSDIVVDSSGNPHIAFTQWAPGNGSYETPNGINSVIYASRDGSIWRNRTVNEGSVYDLALDPHGNPAILYSRSGSLMYACWVGGGWNIQTVDDKGLDASLALDSFGTPHVAYFTRGNATSPFFLKYAVWRGASWNTQIVDIGSLTYRPSIKLDKQNNPHLMYETDIVISTNSSNNSKETLKYATTKDGVLWSIQTVGEDIWYTNFELDANANPHFSYSSKGLVYASWNGQSWNMERINVTAQSGSYLALDQNSSPHIAFANGSLIENYAAFNGTAWEIQTVTSNIEGTGPITIDNNGNPHILFYGPSSGYPPLRTLMYATTAVSSQTSIDPLFNAVLIAVPLIAFLLIIFVVYKCKKKTRDKKVVMTETALYSLLYSGFKTLVPHF